MADPTAQPTREARVPWPDRWLLDALRQQGHPAVERLQAANSAWEAVVNAGASPREILQLVCSLSGKEAASLSAVGTQQAEYLSAAMARRYGVVPVRQRGPVLEVATANPLLPSLERDLSFAAARQVKLTVAAPQEVRAAHERIYGTARGESAAAPRLEWIIKDGPGGGPRASTTRSMVLDSLDRLIADALDQRASDVHFEPKDDDLLVRFRVDGVLHDVTRIGADVAPLVMSRIKVLAGLDIADRRRPQDGRATTKFDGRVVDLRVSTLPLNDRLETAVIRLLDAGNASNGLDALGFTAGELHRVNNLMGQNEGMVLVTGPTGSGKTTTLYAAIEQAKSTQTNIVTVEDPIEYNLDGINQVQVNERAGLGFAAALRSIVRQDPDVILVGEIRDAETAGIAIKAGLTGHLVLSTLHTIDAPSAIGRLADIGVEMGALSGALKGVVAQRLVRKLCDACSTPIALADLPVAQQALLVGRKTEKLRQAVGCDACRQTGYRGRLVVAEILVVTDDMRSAIARHADRVELLDLAKRGGMIPLWEAGMKRVLDGIISIAELLDNVPAPMMVEQGEQSDIDAIVRKLTGAAPHAATTAPSSAAVVHARGLARSATPAHGHAIVPAPQVVVQAVSRTVTFEPRRRHELAPGAPRILLAHEGLPERRALRDALEAAGYAVIEA
ncbi:MAG: Flp pilus assembly complex ATPase component TadA, partial [Gemmatimonadaceae bacterium]|nr:Flp pilus assembly complex ATPase component TadA [Gemmatimonadaceae bacterium]